MTKLSNPRRHQGSSHEWHADTPMTVKPEILESYIDDDGEEMYLCRKDDGTVTEFKALKFKEIFNQAPGLVIDIKSSRYKGESPDKRVLI